MPLTEVARRYADKLYQRSLEEIIQRYQSELVKVRSDHAKRNMLSSGMYIAAHGRLLLEQIRQLGEARADSLLKAYEKAGLPFDDAALVEVQSEVVQLCHNQQHHAVAAISQTIRQNFGGQELPPNLEKAAVNEIVNGVNVVMSHLTRDLSIRRDEIMLDDSKVRKVYAAGLGKKWDVFVCHATEDKEAFVRPLVVSLRASGLAVWYDEFTLTIGDSLRQKIDEGLANSRYGIVVLSKSFFAKNWPKHELDGLVSKEVTGTGTKVILPIWHDISFEEVTRILQCSRGGWRQNPKTALRQWLSSCVKRWGCRLSYSSVIARATPASERVSGSDAVPAICRSHISSRCFDLRCLHTQHPFRRRSPPVQ